MNTQDWSPLGWTGWISLQSKGLSKVFSNTTVQKHLRHSAFFTVQLSHPYTTTGKTIALTRQTFVGKVMSPYPLRNLSAARTYPLLPCHGQLHLFTPPPSRDAAHTSAHQAKTPRPPEHILRCISSVSKETSKQAPPLVSYHPPHVPNILYSWTFKYTQNASSIYVLANFMYQLE